jgi:DNA topoisomerase-1
MPAVRKQEAPAGPALVIVESPAKAKTIAKYLSDLGAFHVEASKGHIRDLPERGDGSGGEVDGEEAEEAAPKADKKSGKAKGIQLNISGVNLDTFEATYVVSADRRETVARLRKLKKESSDVWFATDLDREGEAISWHIAEVLGVDPVNAKRVVFNAITRNAIQDAFAHPRALNMSRVNAQNARRLLDRILGYGISPLLWRVFRKGGLSAGRVQTVAARLVVEREEEIREFVPDERWEVAVRLTPSVAQREDVQRELERFLTRRDAEGTGPTVRERNAFLARSGILEAKLIEVAGSKFELSGEPSLDRPADLSAAVRSTAEAVGLEKVALEVREDPKGRGAARFLRTVRGSLGADVRYRVASVETTRKSRKPDAPFKTSSLQMAASSQLGFATDRTMRVAQQLYEGIDLDGERVGLITYMRTDSTHLAPEAIEAARKYIGKTWGNAYLPEKGQVYASNKDAQEAHEAIRPTDPARTPESVRAALTDEQFALYTLVWRRFLACQMAPKQYDQTSVRFERADRATGAVLRASGSVVVFDGYLKLAEDDDAGEEEATFPRLESRQELAALSVEPVQKFGSPPPRYSEASLVRELEARGIGRPSTYASTIHRIEDKKYVEQRNRRYHATGLGEAVVSVLMGGFPQLFDFETTRRMEERLDRIENNQEDWRAILRELTSQLAGDTLEKSLERMREVPLWKWSPWACPDCGNRLKLRVGGGRWFLSCGTYPECKFAQPVNDAGEPVTAAGVDIVCPIDGSGMVLREGSFGKYVASANYPAVKYIVKLDKKGQVVLPTSPAYQDPTVLCAKCGKPCNIRNGKRGPWLGCSAFPKCRGRGDWKGLGEERQQTILRAIAEHEKAHPPAVLTRQDGSLIEEGTPIEELFLPGTLVSLPMHPDAAKAPQPGEEGFISPYRAAEGVGRRAFPEFR